MTKGRYHDDEQAWDPGRILREDLEGLEDD